MQIKPHRRKTRPKARVRPALRPVLDSETDTVSFVGRTLGAAAAAAYGSLGGVRAGVPLLANLAWGVAEPTLNPALVSSGKGVERANSLLRCALPALASTAASLTLGPVAAAGVAVAACCADQFLLKPLLYSKLEEYSHMPVARQAMGVERLWERGVTGKGTTVAVLDTGGNPHPDLEGRLAAFQDTVEGRSEKLYDGYHHGTMVNSLVGSSGALSQGRFTGAAPESEIVSVRALKGKTGSVDSLISGMEWILENHRSHNIKVVNLSISLKEINPEENEHLRQRYAKLLRLVDQAVKEGMIPVVAAGNNGKVDHLQLLSMSRNIISVANYDTRGTAVLGDDRIAASSARPKRFKPPDVAAMGCDVVFANGAGQYTHRPGGGTSSAAAWVSGVVAAWAQVYPDLTAEEALQAIRATSKPLPKVSRRAQGSGLIQADKGFAWLEAHRSKENSSDGNKLAST